MNITTKMCAAISLCPARLKCHRCYIARANRRHRHSREFTVLLKLLYNDSELCGHNVSQLFETRDTDSKGSIVLTLPHNGKEVLLKDAIPPCIVGGGAGHQRPGCALSRDDDVSRRIDSRLFANRVGIPSA
jgi:hypothetical protein